MTIILSTRFPILIYTTNQGKYSKTTITQSKKVVSSLSKTSRKIKYD